MTFFRLGKGNLGFLKKASSSSSPSSVSKIHSPSLSASASASQAKLLLSSPSTSILPLSTRSISSSSSTSLLRLPSRLILSIPSPKNSYAGGDTSSSSSSLKSFYSSLFPPASSPGVSVFKGLEFPKVVKLDCRLSYLYPHQHSKPIRALTGSTPVYDPMFVNTKYGLIHPTLSQQAKELTYPDYWLPPSRPVARNLVVRAYPPSENWYRLTSDASLPEDRKRAGGGFLLRNSAMKAVCTGEIIFTGRPVFNIRVYEMLTIAWALKQLNHTWFPLEISNDNTFIIDLLNDKRLRENRKNLDVLLSTNLCDRNLMRICQMIMLTIDGHIVVSGGKLSWKDVRFTPMPREANFASDFLANTIHPTADIIKRPPGFSSSIVIKPMANCSTIEHDLLHPILQFILKRDVDIGFPKIPNPDSRSKTRQSLKQRASFARKLRSLSSTSEIIAMLCHGPDDK